jgi:hypothetical protein
MRPEDGNLTIEFIGKKLKGHYALICLGSTAKSRQVHTGEKKWLFFKMKK